MKTKILIILAVALILLLSGCTEVENKESNNISSSDYSKGSTTARVNIVARKNATITDTLNNTNITV